MLVKKRVLFTLFLFLCASLAQSFYVPASYAMQQSEQQGAGAGAQEPTLPEQVKELVRYARDNKCRTAYALVPFLNFKAYGLADAASSGLQMFPQFQEVMYGKEDVTNAEIIRLIRAELAALNVPDHNSIPIKKKTGRFESAYESIIVHPTNKIIYVDEEFLTRQKPELRAFIIKTALKHYLNGTFGKVSLAQLTFAGAGMYVVPKANRFINRLVREGASSFFSRFQSQPADAADNVATSTSSVGSFMHNVGSGALNMAVTAGTMWAWDKTKRVVVGAYVRRTQGRFDRQMTDKAGAKRLLGAVEADAQRNPRDHRQDDLLERLSPFNEDELSVEWERLTQNLKELLQKFRESNTDIDPLTLHGEFNSFGSKIPESDKRKAKSRQITDRLISIIYNWKVCKELYEKLESLADDQRTNLMEELRDLYRNLPSNDPQKGNVRKMHEDVLNTMRLL